MTENIENIYDKYPQMICHTIKMEKPNQSIPIYSGDFSLIQNDRSIQLTGTINFEWFPIKKVMFKGVVQKSEIDILSIFDSHLKNELIVKNQVFGECQISGTNINKNTEVEGFMIKDPVWGDRTIEVSSLRFAITNLRDFHAKPVKNITNGKIHFSMNRLVLEDNEYQITLDGLSNYTKLKDELNLSGGYIIQYNGELRKTSKMIHQSDLKVIIPCLSSFLSFLNGRRVSSIFHQGIHDEEIIWTDYTIYKTDMFKTVFNWSVWDETSEFNHIWKVYRSLWSDENDRDFIDSVIHWYLEANKNSGYIEGTIIMIQIGLELIYNWFLIEKKKLILGKDADNLTAANKIRLLLSQIKVPTETPSSLSALNTYISETELPDGIEAFVQIRNALVHSQETKRRKLQKINSQVLIDAHDLGLWYLELSILYILGYKGIYCSRCSDKLWNGSNFLRVPWISTVEEKLSTKTT